jgi:hypothetical protein
MLVSHTCIFVIDHVEQGRAEPPEPAPVEDADYEKDQGKASASNRNPWIILFFFYITYDSWMCIRL